jgi:protein KRI1
MADDKDLNQYMGIKKYAPYRKGGNWDKQRPERLKEFRDKLNARRANGNGEDGEALVKKRKGKKERQKAKAAAAGGTEPEPDELRAGGKEKRKLEELSETVQTEVGSEANPSKKRKRRHKKSSQVALVE